MNEEEYEARMRLAAGVRLALAKMDGTKAQKAARVCTSLTSLNNWINGNTAPNDVAMARLRYHSGLSDEQIRGGRLDSHA